MRLPANYEVVADGDCRWLYEHTWLLASVPPGREPVHKECRIGPLAGQYVRPVARFRSGAKIKDIEETARWDHASRNRGEREDRKLARFELARRFGQSRGLTEDI